MNNKFKRALSSILAFVMLCSCMCVMNVSSVLAATKTIVDYRMPASTDGIDLPTGSGKTTLLLDDTGEDKSGIKLSWQRGATDSFSNTKVTLDSVDYTTAIKTGSNNKSQLVIEGVKTGDVITVVFGDQNSATNAYTISDDYDTSNYCPKTTSKVENNATTTSLKAKTASKVTHTALADGIYYAGYTSSKGGTYAVIIERPIVNGYTFKISDNASETYAGTFAFTPATIETWSEDSDIVITYTGDDYTLADTSVKAVASNFTLDETAKTATYDVSNLTLTAKTYKATVVQGDYTGTFKLSKSSDIGYNDTFTLSYEGTDKTMTEQTFSVVNKTDAMSIADGVITITPVSTWFKDILATKSVTPTTTENENEVVYKFQVDDGKSYYLVSETDKQDDTAYSKDEEGCNVVLDSTGAKLVDDSTAKAATLVVPCSVSSGKVTISGTVIPTSGNSGSKWALVNIGGLVFVSTDNSASSKKLAISSTSDFAPVDDNAGVVVKDQTITYSVTLDFSDNSYTGTIKNGTSGEEKYSGTFTGSFSNQISYVTNNSGAGTSARTLTIPSVTIQTEAAEDTIVIDTVASTSAVAHVKYNDTHYAVVTVSDIADVVKLSITKDNEEVAYTDTVYTSVTFDKAYTAKDFNTSITSGGYVFAFAIDNDNSSDDTAIANAIENITVSAVKSDATAE